MNGQMCVVSVLSFGEMFTEKPLVLSYYQHNIRPVGHNVCVAVTSDHSTGLNMLSRFFYGLDEASGSLI